VVITRGDVWWVELGEPIGAATGFRRPVLIVQSEPFNRSQIRTVVGVVLTSSMRLLDAPGNTLVSAKASGLPKDSVANVSQLVTLDQGALRDRMGRLSRAAMQRVDDGLRLVLSLGR
jgi:mRNA interferase MazF